VPGRLRSRLPELRRGVQTVDRAGPEGILSGPEHPAHARGTNGSTANRTISAGEADLTTLVRWMNRGLVPPSERFDCGASSTSKA
jgi:hypothetical protein